MAAPLLDLVRLDPFTTIVVGRSNSVETKLRVGSDFGAVSKFLKSLNTFKRFYPL